MERSVVLVPELDGQTTAILEDENLSVTAPTRQEALDRLRFRMERMSNGEVERITVDLPETHHIGVSALAGAFAEDPDLPGLVNHAYAARDQACSDSLVLTPDIPQLDEHCKLFFGFFGKSVTFGSRKANI